jgi:Uma2 family endonuclease
MSAAVLAATETPRVVEDEVETYFKERGKPMPGAEHARCQMRLGFEFMQAGTHAVLSELNLDLEGYRCVPDLCVYQKQDESAIRNLARVTLAPQIAVKIISPDRVIEEMTAEIEQLLAHGVPSVWFVLPFARVITIYQKSAPLISCTAGILADPVTGVKVNVDEVFA